MDLDVDAPDEVAGVLREAAQAYYEAESELSSAWGDPQAGKVWTKIAKILERAADQIDKIV
jgi:phage terminase small subunit